MRTWIVKNMTIGEFERHVLEQGTELPLDALDDCIGLVSAEEDDEGTFLIEAIDRRHNVVTKRVTGRRVEVVEVRQQERIERVAFERGEQALYDLMEEIQRCE